MPTLTLRVITPDRIALDRQVDSVRLPALDGSLGVLPRHAPMVAALDVGLLRYTAGGRDHVLFVSGGFAEMHGDTLRVVTQASEAPADIDLARVQAAEKRARARLEAAGVTVGSVVATVGRTTSALVREPSGDPTDVSRAQAALRRALLRAQAKGYAASA
jgi:F-type H+-transporting ATPase subunit epsilon